MRFPYFIQHDSKDCGPTCLRMIAKYYGKNYALQFLKEKSYQKRTGTSFLGLSDAAESIGFRTIGVKITWEQLSTQVNLPCIIQWNKNHFVVVYKITKEKIIVGDPAQGILKYDRSTFLKCWLSIIDNKGNKLGVALLLDPSLDFHKSQKTITNDKLDLWHLTKYLKPYSRYIVHLFISLLVGSGLSLIFPVLTQSVVDIGIGDSNINFVIAILLAQVSLTVGKSFNDLIRNWLMLHVTTRISISLIADFLSKLMRLPISFFDSKRVGDLLQRIRDFSRIQNFLTGSLISIVMAIVGFIAYSSIVATYNLLIFGIFLAGSIIYIFWVFLFLKKRRKIDYIRFQESANNQGNMIQLINGMQEIKLNNCEKQKRLEWEKIQTKLYDIEIKGLTIAQTQEIGGMFIDQTKNVFISFLAASIVINGNMTLGMMMALQYIIGQLNAPIHQFIMFIQSIQDTKISLERLNEIQTIEDEEPKDPARINKIPITSDLELKNVSFQYNGPRSPKILNNINLTIEANKVTAIVGTSGSGKTTLLKLLLGFYEPVDGNITLNHIPLNKYSQREWRRSCGVVMQEGFIFSDTIANNVGVIDKLPKMNRVKDAAKVANINTFINSLPLGFNTEIGAEGIGLSTGQKQRVLIARAVYKNAKYIMFDEATNALDANNELVIMNNLNKFFEDKTVVIVAHRLSTVKNADKIVVIDKGKIVEQGIHNELVTKKGSYFNLVKNQLELGS